MPLDPSLTTLLLKGFMVIGSPKKCHTCTHNQSLKARLVRRKGKKNKYGKEKGKEKGKNVWYGMERNNGKEVLFCLTCIF